MDNKRKCPAGNGAINSRFYNSKCIKIRGRKQGKSFAEVNSHALASINSLLPQWLPNGRKQGHEYVALNPKRADRNLGSFRINLNKGCWADFATGDKGGDLVSLAAYLFDLSQGEAKQLIQNTLGV